MKALGNHDKLNINGSELARTLSEYEGDAGGAISHNFNSRVTFLSYLR